MTIVRFICAAWILPAGFSLIAFFGFFTNYTTDVFSRPGIEAQYSRSVFKYRILGRYLVEAVSSGLERMAVAWPTPRAFTTLDPAGAAPTYWAYVIVHTLAVCAGCSILLLCLRRFRPSLESELAVIGVAMLMALQAFVVTPYDGVFFALQMAALATTLLLPPATALLPLAGITLLAGLTRETAYFIPVFFLAVHHQRMLESDRRAWTTFAASVAMVIATYAGLRIVLDWNGASSVFYAWQAAGNLKWTSLTGTAMLAAALVLLTGTGANRAARFWYAAAATPYIVFVHLFAEPWELRLWIPILVPMLVLLMVPDRRVAVSA